jgi:hypothetical protein
MEANNSRENNIEKREKEGGRGETRVSNNKRVDGVRNRVLRRDKAHLRCVCLLFFREAKQLRNCLRTGKGYKDIHISRVTAAFRVDFDFDYATTRQAW